MKKGIVYLGELTWREAIDEAAHIGLIIPSSRIMMRIIEAFRSDIDYYPNDERYITSTTYMNSTSRFVLPTNKNVLQIKNNDTEMKDVKRKAYAVSSDISELDIMTHNYEIFFNLDQFQIRKL